MLANQTPTLPHVVIVGGGFGGISAAQALRRAPVRITLIDRSNHHLFQPLLYQVATADLAPGQIASPIRQILRGQKNATVVMMEVKGVDPAARTVRVDYLEHTDRAIPYDYLILATGAQQSYFGKDEWRQFAPGLKTLSDATAIRDRVLKVFETAELEEDRERHPSLMTFILVGGGPTGVEMSGAIAELARNTLGPEFRRIDPRRARVILIEAGPRILPAFSEDLAHEVHQRLAGMGVEVIVGKKVEQIDARGVIVGGERIDSHTVIWTAGVQPSPAGKWLGAATDRIGRVKVEPDLSAPGHPEIFVVGDTAFREQDGKPLPGVAQVAMQGGRYVASVISAHVRGKDAPGPFHYVDKGNLAVVGRGFAIMESSGMKLSGYPAWLVWALIHIHYLALFNNRLLVFVQWAWTYLTRQRGSRLIMRDGDIDLSEPEPAEPQIHADTRG
jgi:NADH dehydrogenase